MDFGLSEDQVLLKQTIKRFLDEQCPTTRVRTVMESDSGHDSTLWQGLVDLGVAGLIVPAEQGGSGLELLDLALAAEELGYAAAPGPFLSSSMSTIGLVEGNNAAVKQTWLPKIANGEAILTIAVGEADGEWSVDRLKATVSGGRLSGEKPFVPYASIADAILVAANDDSGTGLWLVERGAAGISTQALSVVDMTRRLETVRFDNTPAVKVGDHSASQRMLDAGCVLIAADAYGGSRRCLEMTVDYAKTREQFGQIIGAFQSVKHQLANLACELEPSLALYWYAAHAFDRIPDKSERHAAMVKAHMSDLYDRVARDTTELHGGIGFTWEFDLHLWFRRSVFDRGFLGDAAFHRERAAVLAGW